MLALLAFYVFGGIYLCEGALHLRHRLVNDADCRLWIVTGAGHTAALQTDPEGFKQRVVSWFREHQQSRLNIAK
jgi:hypothetical protein